MSEGKEAARAFFRTIGLTTIAATNAQIVDLTNRLERAEAIIQHVTEETALRLCEGCHRLRSCHLLDESCKCQTGTRKLYCRACFDERSVKHQMVHCGTCRHFRHEICEIHCQYAVCEYDSECKGSPYFEASCSTFNMECKICNRKICNKHESAREFYCVDCDAEVDEFERQLQRKRLKHAIKK